MPSPIETVEAFLAMLEQPGGFSAGVQAFFTPHTRYLNVGMSDTTGIEQALAFVQGFEASMGATSMRADMLAIAATGNTVMTERIDHLIGTDGQTVVSITLMGVFEVQGGKIIAWRDYFDTAGLATSMAAK